MANQPWKTDNWFVSQWNYADEVRKDFKFAEQIKVHDITLRDGEQQTGVILTKDDKIRIAEGLAEAGVHRIEAGMPIVSPSDAEAIKAIVKRNLGPQIFAFSRCMKEDVQRAIDTGVNGVVMEIPSSQHMVELAYKWPMEKAIETSIEATRFARDNGLEVVFFPIDFSRSEMNWVLNLIERVGREGHMDALALVDTFGVVSPHAMQYFVRQVKKRINKRLEAHFHQDFGMGVANTIMALAEGVEVMHTTVLGVGERAGNTPMEETVMALLTMYGIDIGLNYSKLTPLANLVQELTGVVVPTNKPVVGRQLYQIESGIIASWFRNCGEKNATELFPVRWNFVGQPPAEVVMGKGSGIDSVKAWLEHMGIEASEEEATKITAGVKSYSLKTKKLLTETEFRKIAEDVVGQRAAA
ncbi:MAG: pyruvate carboxyltransferase [Betaproteobacteria bacterium RIFCSPLOWO2_12_FULL_62_13]|nr:MAG: pyruvate carboxyltransferase [Betaproteobacteria bacterium RIFCSPLOWO2_12_FULL_62_13]